MAVADKLGNAFLSTFETLGVEPDMARRGVSQYATVDSWIASQTTQAAVLGGAASAIPGLHHAGVLADAALLVHKMAIMTWGIGYKLGAEVDGKLDLANVLALWSGAAGRDVLTVGGIGAVGGAIAVAGTVSYGSGSAFAVAVAAKIAGKAAGAGAAYVAAELGAKGAAKAAGLVAGKLASATMTHVAPYVGAKLAAKIAALQVTGWVPVFGAAVAGGVNVWVMKTLAEHAQRYYQAKVKAQA